MPKKSAPANLVTSWGARAPAGQLSSGLVASGKTSLVHSAGMWYSFVVLIQYSTSSALQLRDLHIISLYNDAPANMMCSCSIHCMSAACAGRAGKTVGAATARKENTSANTKTDAASLPVGMLKRNSEKASVSQKGGGAGSAKSAASAKTGAATKRSADLIAPAEAQPSKKRPRVGAASQHGSSSAAGNGKAGGFPATTKVQRWQMCMQVTFLLIQSLIAAVCQRRSGMMRNCSDPCGKCAPRISVCHRP